MRKKDYKQIFEQHAIPPDCYLIGQNFIMQQVKDPKYTSKLCKGFLLLKETQGFEEHEMAITVTRFEPNQAFMGRDL